MQPFISLIYLIIDLQTDKYEISIANNLFTTMY